MILTEISTLNYHLKSFKNSWSRAEEYIKVRTLYLAVSSPVVFCSILPDVSTMVFRSY